MALTQLEVDIADALNACKELLLRKHDQHNYRMQMEANFPHGEQSFFDRMKEADNRVDDDFWQREDDVSELSQKHISNVMDKIVYAAAYLAHLQSKINHKGHKEL